MKKELCVAIDGPAAAGKSTIAKKLASELNYIYIDTGAMYRGITYCALRDNVDLENGEAILQLLNSLELELKHVEGTQRIFVNGEDISEAIRSPKVTSNVSLVASHKEIRDEMVRRQQRLATRGGVVMDGRDIGTHVLPFAEVKIFMVASVDERAERRHRENQQKGFESDLETLKKEIAARDHYDSTREHAPLTQAQDAVLVDTTGKTIEEVTKEIKAIFNEKSNNVQI